MRHNLTYIHICISIIGVCVFTPLWATQKNLDTAQKELDKIEQQLIQAKSKKQTSNVSLIIVNLRTQMQKNAENLQNSERNLLKIQSDLQKIKQQKQALQNTLIRLNQDIGRLLAIVHNIEKNKHLTLLVSPKATKKTMTAMTILQHIMPQINAKKQQVKDTNIKITQLESTYIQKQNSLQQQKRNMQSSKTELNKKITAYNKKLSRDTASIAKLQQQHQKLQKKVQSIQKLLDATIVSAPTIKKRTKRPDNVRAFPMENGKITSPVAGKITTKFQQKTTSGSTSDGIHIRTLPNAQVVAPFDGYISYVGAFQNLGRIVIISHERGYNTVLIGFNDIYVQPNDWVLEKDPIGTTNTENKDFKIEIRYGTKIENPLLWIKNT